MNVNEYQKEAMTLLNPAIPQKDVLLNALMGLCGESGEAIDLMKKHLYQAHELDRDKLIKELGDVCWYVAEIASALDTDLDTVMQKNIDKLRARYPEGFDTLRSQSRSEKDGE